MSKRNKTHGSNGSPASRREAMLNGIAPFEPSCRGWGRASFGTFVSISNIMKQTFSVVNFRSRPTTAAARIAVRCGATRGTAGDEDDDAWGATGRRS